MSEGKGAYVVANTFAASTWATVGRLEPHGQPFISVTEFMGSTKDCLMTLEEALMDLCSIGVYSWSNKQEICSIEMAKNVIFF